jgi:predicted nucleic acid-binding protein
LIYFLVDSSAVWRLQRKPELTEAWNSSLLSGAVGSCEPQRAEFRRSARNADEFDQMNQTFRDVYPDVPVPKSVWRWIDSAQHLLAGAGAVRTLSVVDLLICGTAAASSWGESPACLEAMSCYQDNHVVEVAFPEALDIRRRGLYAFPARCGVRRGGRGARG